MVFCNNFKQCSSLPNSTVVRPMELCPLCGKQDFGFKYSLQLGATYANFLTDGRADTYAEIFFSCRHPYMALSLHTAIHSVDINTDKFHGLRIVVCGLVFFFFLILSLSSRQPMAVSAGKYMCYATSTLTTPGSNFLGGDKTRDMKKVGWHGGNFWVRGHGTE